MVTPTRLASLARLALLSALVVCAGAARAEPPGPGAGGKPWAPPDARLEQQLRELGLDSDQLARAQAILAEARRAREESDARLQQAFDEMRSLLEQDTPDEAAVMSQADRIGAIRTESRKSLLRALLAVRAELSPEQRAKLNEMMRREGPPWRRGVHPEPPAGARPPGPPPGSE